MAKIFLRDARLVDGTGAPAVEHAVLVYEEPETGEGGTSKAEILYAGPEEDCPYTAGEEDRVAGLAGYTLLPGLINTHVHLYSMNCGDREIPYLTLMYFRHLAESLFAGVTTVRSVGGSDNIDVALRDAVQNGLVWGPRLITCGSPILPHGGHCFHTRGSVQCSGPDEFVRAVRTELGKGVDQIKLMYSGGAGGTSREGMFNKHILDEEGRAACETAHMNGKIVSAHLSNDEAVCSAVRCGVDSVEHAYRICRETARLMAEYDVFYAPTLTVTDIDRACEGFRSQISEPVIRRLSAARSDHLMSARYAFEEGVKKFCTGTDTVPSDRMDGTFATIREAELLTEIGLSPLQAIRAATVNGAELCGLSGVTGQLKEGLAGDIIAVKGKPDQNISDLRNLSMVIRDCRVVWSEVPGFEREKSFWPFTPGRTELVGLASAWPVD